MGIGTGRGFVAAALACLVALAALVAIVLWREPDLHRAEPHPVIYPGHESRVVRFVEPLAHGGFAGLAAGDIQIHGAAIRVQLRSTDAPADACAVPSWARSPGGVQITLLPGSPDERPHADGPTGRVRATDCCSNGLSADAIPRCSSRPADSCSTHCLLARTMTSGVCPPTRRTRRPRRSGFLTPALRLTGISHQRFTAAWFLIAFAVTLAIVAVGWRANVRIEPFSRGDAVPRRSGTLHRVTVGILVALSIGGAAVRFATVQRLPQDGDEVWAEPSPHPILTDDHDAWVHPPAFRTVQQFWAHRSHWHAGDGISRLRTPSVLFAMLALFVVAFGAYASRSSLAATVPIGMLAFAPGIVRASVLARPYALAALLLSVLVVALWGSIAERHTDAIVVAYARDRSGGGIGDVGRCDGGPRGVAAPRRAPGRARGASRSIRGPVVLAGFSLRCWSGTRRSSPVRVLLRRRSSRPPRALTPRGKPARDSPAKPTFVRHAATRRRSHDDCSDSRGSATAKRARRSSHWPPSSRCSRSRSRSIDARVRSNRSWPSSPSRSC